MVSENEFLLHSLLMGVFVTFVYDLLRIFRRVVRHGSFLVSLEDLAFWIYCGAQVFLLMYRESNGTMRWFSVIGAMTGIFAYRKLVSPLLVKYVSIALTKLLGLLFRALGWLCRPLRLLGAGAGRACRRAGGGMRRSTGRICHRIGRWKRALKNRLTLSVKLFKISLKK